MTKRLVGKPGNDKFTTGQEKKKKKKAGKTRGILLSEEIEALQAASFVIVLSFSQTLQLVDANLRRFDVGEKLQIPFIDSLECPASGGNE